MCLRVAAKLESSQVRFLRDKIQPNSDALQFGGLLGFLHEDELHVLEARGLEAVRGDVHHGAVRRHGEVRRLHPPHLGRGLVLGHIYRLCGMVWYGVVWYGVMGCGVVRSVVMQCLGWGLTLCGAVCSIVVLCGVALYGVVRLGMVWFDVVWYGVVWCGVVWYGICLLYTSDAADE